MARQDYRIQVLIRRKGEPFLEGTAFKTEQYRNLAEIVSEIDTFLDTTIDDDKNYLDGRVDE